MNKQVLRAMFLEKRKTLTDQEHSLRSELVCEQAIQFIEEKKYAHIHLFLPLLSQKEPNTNPLFQYLLTSGKHHVALPKVNTGSNLMEHLRVTAETEFIRGKYGITEPQTGEVFNTHELEAVFVPLITFDRKGNRIGYGGGYYDRFFEAANHIVKIGLAITPPLDEIPYYEAHDIPLDFCINHHKIYAF